ncbi:MAG: hypothetical protein MI919_33225 [Holophagales bacterium]|nr:hypothetical protein [Holophagales bacterium]
MRQDPTWLRYRGGLLGAFAPLMLFLAGVTWLGLSGAPGEQGFWPILVASLALGMMLSRDRHAYSEALIEGMSQPIIMVMILAWLLAGILAALMSASGFVEALVWLADAGGVRGVSFVIAAFLVSCAVSTSTGTSLGTLILCSPLLYPAGGPLGAPPELLLGAILGGATFGDNISPVSDTTIASTVTQGARMGEVVRSLLRYALPAAALALMATVVAGAVLESPEPDPAAMASVPFGQDEPQLDGGLPAAHTSAEPGGSASGTRSKGVTVSSNDGEVEDGEVRPGEPDPRGLPMLLAPVLVIFLLFRHIHLLEGLVVGILSATGLALILGLIAPSDLLYVDPEQITAGGILVEGMQRGVGVSIFTILLMGLVAGLEASGVISRLLGYASRHIDSPRSAEWWSFGTISAATLVTTHSVVALLAVGPFARETGFRQGIPATRRANLLDTTVCTYPFLLPYCIPTILAASTTSDGPLFGMPTLPAATAGLFNFHSWALLLVVLVVIATGWGRGQATLEPALREPRSPWDDSSDSGSDSDSSTSSFFELGPPLGARSGDWTRPRRPRQKAMSLQETEKIDLPGEAGSQTEAGGRSGAATPGVGTGPTASLFEETERIELPSDDRGPADEGTGDETPRDAAGSESSRGDDGGEAEGRRGAPDSAPAPNRKPDR